MQGGIRTAAVLWRGKKLLLLAELTAPDEDDLICDFAQYYQVLDWRALPLRLAAVLAAGLPADSRCKMRLRGERAPADQLLLAVIADDLNLLCWKLFAAGGSRAPRSIYNALQGIPEAEDKNGIKSFDSAEEFEEARRAALGGERNGRGN
ncbi:MAG: hypothetical protein ACI4JC_03840 [Faecalibacterium sp.]